MTTASAFIRRIEVHLQKRGLAIFCRVDHSGEAEKAGLQMRPTQLVLFGNLKRGTPVMLASPTIAIDLPLKALIWEDTGGKVWVSGNSPEYLKLRHNVPAELVKNFSAVRPILQQALEERAESSGISGNQCSKT